MFLGIVLAATIRVSAAASLTDALREIAGPYQKQSGHSLLFNLGASSMLARQIEQGAPADLFISADELRMDELQRRGLIVPRSRRSILSNTLVIIIPSDSTRKISSPQDLIDRGIRHIAAWDPDTTMQRGTPVQCRWPGLLQPARVVMGPTEGAPKNNNKRVRQRHARGLQRMRWFFPRSCSRGLAASWER